MRNLVIKREKSFVGCLGKFKVYIVDPNSNDLKINKQPCRKLGILKNGEEAAFQIPDEEVQLYIIGDKMTKSFCNEFVKISAGDSDVCLLGKCKYNPFMGNPFRLEGQVDEATKANRKRSKKKALTNLLPWILVGFVFGFCFGFFSDAALTEPETFEADGMQITLIQEFVEVPYNGFAATYETDDMLVAVTKETKPLSTDLKDITLDEYAELLISSQEEEGIVCSDLLTENGLKYFEYQIADGDGTYYYRDYVYETQDAFWHITFICSNETSWVANITSIPEWAQSVTFN